MKKILFLFLILFCKASTRELTLILDTKHSDTHVHYITVSWNHPETGPAQLHHGPIQISIQKPEATIKNITEEQITSGIYITSIQAKNLDHDPRSFFYFESNKQNKNNKPIKIEFPDIPNHKNSEKDATYIICIGNKCPIQKGITEQRTLNNDNKNSDAPKSLEFCITPCHDKDCLT